MCGWYKTSFRDENDYFQNSCANDLANRCNENYFSFRVWRCTTYVPLPALKRMHACHLAYLYVQHRDTAYKGSGLLKVYVRLAPLMVIQYVRGSVPICSFVAPVDCAGVMGNVTGIVVPHVLPPAVKTVTLSMPLPSAVVCQVRLGRHWSRAWRARKVTPRSSCLRVLNGQVVLGWSDEWGSRGEEYLQPHNLCGDGFDPSHEQRILARFAIDDGVGDIADSEVCLVEHVAVYSINEGSHTG